MLNRDLIELPLKPQVGDELIGFGKLITITKVKPQDIGILVGNPLYTMYELEVLTKKREFKKFICKIKKPEKTVILELD